MAATREPGRLGAVLDQAEVDRGRLDSAAVGTFSLTTLGVASVVGAGIFVTTFVEHTPLLLLDEPTAHLDAASEGEIVAVIRRLAASSTTVVASHSPALLAGCDRVITLDRGQLIAAPSVWAIAEAA
jgi:alpha-D-ribose 1-methylphosphonate 5-triphosphate synthase subunit PhnL